jgi:hypothetical protein
VKVYIVSQGEYSDYRVEAIFDEHHLEEARRFARMTGGDLEENDPFEINAPNMDEPPPGVSYFRVCLKADGEALCRKYQLLNDDGCRHDCTWYVDEFHGLWNVNVNLYARDDSHAVKVASEIRTQILAGVRPKSGKWREILDEAPPLI